MVPHSTPLSHGYPKEKQLWAESQSHVVLAFQADLYWDGFQISMSSKSLWPNESAAAHTDTEAWASILRIHKWVLILAQPVWRWLSHRKPHHTRADRDAVGTEFSHPGLGAAWVETNSMAE